MGPFSTLNELLQQGEDDAVALAAPGRPPLAYRGLRAHIAAVAAQLNGMGIGRNDRVAIIQTNGPEMASVFLTVAAGAGAAPLNPSYQAQELEFYLSDIGVKAVILGDGLDSPVVQVANQMRIPVLRLIPSQDAEAGRFTLTGEAAGPPREAEPPRPEDVALLLHTSGTTARPKLVPLRQKNLCQSAANIVSVLGLQAEDRCLSVMPMFHIHGLIAALLAPVSSGGSVVCPPGFNAFQFFRWVDEFKPTWYSAVPTMHQAILSRAAKNREILKRCRLRFIRSSSASLPVPVITELEKTFNAPVIESYGMTEATHQMTSNPLPPKERKPGTVGMAAGPEVTIMDAQGNELPRGERGEVVIRGPSVMGGYENNPDANASAFHGDWFRTGDEGWMDEEGYLTITGRLKELINRGGEKIAPREVDDVIQEHPAVAQVVTFAMPHEKLGEEVAAAVVLTEGKSATESEIRDFAAKRLAPFKVPRKVVFLDEIPKGATGKLQRIGLAEKLGLAG